MQDFLKWASPRSEEWHAARRLEPARMPRHIAVIMDGNGRWARRRFLPRAAGHRAGVRSVRQIIEDCCRLGIDALTLYAFSVENWKRPQAEIETLWALLREYIRRELPELKANGVRFQAIGRIEDLPEAVRDDLDNAMLETAANEGMRLQVALNYGGRTEIVDVVNNLLRRAHNRGDLLEVDEGQFGSLLWTAKTGDPDLLIRTSGEFRLSNFLLWQLAYAEIWVTDRFWPEFRTMDLLQALEAYQGRERRYGGLSSRDRTTADGRKGKLQVVGD